MNQREMRQVPRGSFGAAKDKRTKGGARRHCTLSDVFKHSVAPGLQCLHVRTTLEHPRVESLERGDAQRAVELRPAEEIAFVFPLAVERLHGGEVPVRNVRLGEEVVERSTVPVAGDGVHLGNPERDLRQVPIRQKGVVRQPPRHAGHIEVERREAGGRPAGRKGRFAHAEERRREDTGVERCLVHLAESIAPDGDDGPRLCRVRRNDDPA